MAILDKSPASSLPEGEAELLRYLHKNPNVYSVSNLEEEPLCGVEAIADFAGQLVTLSGVAIEFESRFGFHLRLPEPRPLNNYPTVISDVQRTRTGLETVTFRFFNEPPFGRGELVTAYAQPDDSLTARPIYTELLQS